jgi:hypothetical protein
MVKGKVAPIHTLEAYRRSGDVVPFILYFITRK